MKVVLRVGGALVAAAIFAYVLSRIGIAKLAAQVAEAGPGFVWILVLHLLAMVAAALPWHVLLPPRVRPSVLDTVASRFLASGANAALPLFGLGGELARLLWLRKGDRAAGVAALVVDRIAYGVASIALLLAGVIGLAHVPELPADYTTTAALAGVALVVLLVLGALLAARGGVTARILRLLRRDPAFGDDVDAELTRSLRLGNRAAWHATGLHVVGRALIGAEIVVGFALLGRPLAWDEALVFAALPVILSLVAAVLPSQLGIHEGVQAIVAASFGISTTTAVAVILLIRLRQLVGVVTVGPYLLVRHNRFVRTRRGTIENPAR